MAHSSGGGSSFGGGGSYGGGSVPGFRVIRPLRRQKYPFEGSIPYVYYEDKRPCYLHADGNLLDFSEIKTQFFVSIIIFLVFLFPFFTFWKTAVVAPKKLPDTGQQIRVMDDLGVFENAELQKELELFYEKTGICPVLISQYSESWEHQYNTSGFENYALDKYKELFEDENHWLLIYSCRESAPQVWFWHGVQGDHTDSILKSNITEEFNGIVQSALKNEGASPDQAFTQAFRGIYPELMTANGLLFRIVLGLFAIALLLYPLKIAFLESDVFRRVHYKTHGIKRISETAKEHTCTSCNGVYVYEYAPEAVCPFCDTPFRETAENTAEA